uniref:Smad nuclear interacting protein 1 n=1 Tax=Gorilla gorilla gorilla TaxID=9595 RepID=A0A2I2Z7L1_GORGO
MKAVKSERERGSRSPPKKKNKASGRRSKSPRSKRNRSPHHSTVKVKQSVFLLLIKTYPRPGNLQKKEV